MNETGKKFDIQQIINDKLQAILDLIRAEIPQAQQEPEYIIIKELKKYFKS